MKIARFWMEKLHWDEGLRKKIYRGFRCVMFLGVDCRGRPDHCGQRRQGAQDGDLGAAQALPAVRLRPRGGQRFGGKKAELPGQVKEQRQDFGGGIPAHQAADPEFNVAFLKSIPCFLMRYCKVERGTPKRAAAPRDPPTMPPVRTRVWRM